MKPALELMCLKKKYLLNTLQICDLKPVRWCCTSSEYDPRVIMGISASILWSHAQAANNYEMKRKGYVILKWDKIFR